jgi:membrane protein DedA with SNARE-associated domain
MTLSLADLTDSILSWMIIYGPVLILAILFLGALGAPAPGTFLVLAAGAFVRQGVLDLEWTLLSALAGACLGDAVSFGMGLFARGFIGRRFGAAPVWQKAEAELNRRGGIAIYLTRWLLTPLAVPVNLVAGSTGYPFARFLLFDFAGELTWVLLFGTLGYTFSSQWEAISDFIGNFSGLLVGIVVLAVGVYVLIRSQFANKALST